jgi:hypothetical protein
MELLSFSLSVAELAVGEPHASGHRSGADAARHHGDVLPGRHVGHPDERRENFAISV